MRVTLQVGERRFETTTDTLKGAAYFEAITATRWESQKQSDGSYFVDADPDIFEHILRYLRHEILPVHYDQLKGHGYALYLAMLHQAEYFQIPALAEWLKEKRYLRAVTIEHSASIVTGNYPVLDTTKGDTTVEYHPTWKTEQVYVCPRGVSAHRGNPRGCGRQCKNEQGDREADFAEELVLSTLAITRKTVFNHELCVEE